MALEVQAFDAASRAIWVIYRPLGSKYAAERSVFVFSTEGDSHIHRLYYMDGDRGSDDFHYRNCVVWRFGEFYAYVFCLFGGSGDCGVGVELIL